MMTIIDYKGKVKRTLGQKGIKDFVTACVSHGGKLVYAVTEDSVMYCFNMSTGSWVGQTQLCESEVIGITSHPFSNVIAANDETGKVFLLKPESNK